MEKTATLNLRVNPTVKERAEKVLSQLGVPMSTAIDMYLNQISLTGGIPFSVSLPKAPVSIHADAMTTLFCRCRQCLRLLLSLFYSYPIQCPQSLKVEDFAQLTDAFRVKQGANVRACFGMLLTQQHSAIATH